MQNALIFDIETVPFFEHPDPSISKNTILKEEYDKYYKIEEQRKKVGTDTNSADGHANPDIFIPYPQFNVVVAIAWLVAKWNDNDSIWEIDTKSTGEDNIGSLCSIDELKILSPFIKYVNTNAFEYFVHFNGINYDVPLIKYRSVIRNIPITNKKFNNLYKFTLDNHFDLKAAISNFGKFPINFRTLCASLGIPDPKANVKGSDVSKLFQEKRYKEIATYCKGDVLNTFEGFKKIFPHFV